MFIASQMIECGLNPFIESITMPSYAYNQRYRREHMKENSIAILPDEGDNDLFLLFDLYRFQNRNTKC
jgi:hypothetical protein